ncbi:cortical protein marker for cell polarity-domain-containing protein [Pilobolus umbonatus]|nr:cortical protein marker for cell polarity-domain-containing protein [Pilobolus umbonatus]
MHSPGFILLIILHIQLIQSIAVPTLSIETVGQLGFIGNYAGISVYRDPLQFESIGSSEQSNQTVAMIRDNDHLFKLFSTINGYIDHSCQLDKTTVILAGSFDTINNEKYNNIAQLNTETMQLSPLNQGLDGPVRSLYCINNNVYVGGDFMSPVDDPRNDFTGHVALWNNAWIPLPWKGFNGPVYSIINKSHESILFGGQFDSTGDGLYFNKNTSQSINLSLATISGGNTALMGNNTNPSTVICGKSPWLLQDSVPGYWEAQFTSSFQPSIFRLSNAHSDNRNTNSFNIISLGSNQYFELSYIDPFTKEIVTCSRTCYMSNDPTVLYQDYTVLSPISTSALRINIDTWYGNGGGLSSVQIFRSDVSLQPSSTSNMEPSTCDNSPSSTVSTTGEWTTRYSYGAYQDFLVSSFPVSELPTTNVSVIYKPHISTQGDYEVYITTPGCVGTGTCNERTALLLDVEVAPKIKFTYSLDQRVSSDERILIYNGSVSASSSLFNPSITMRLSPNSPAPSSGYITVIASSAEFVKNSKTSSLSSILEYFPSNNTWVSLTDQLPIGSTVRSMQFKDNTLYIGGQFKAPNGFYSNIVSFKQGGLQPLADSGLNGNVHSLFLKDSYILVGGNFTNTVKGTQNGMKNIAVYNTGINSWSPINEGVDGQVDHIFTTPDNTIHISGAFTTLSGDGTSVYNNIMVNSALNAWINTKELVIGPVTSVISIKDNNLLYMGKIKNAQSYRAKNASAIIDNQVILSSLVTDIDPSAVVTAGLFWKNTTSNNEFTTILAGSFKFNKDKNITHHIAIGSKGEWRGLMDDAAGTIDTLAIVQGKLFIGGKFTGTVNNIKTNSFAIYDLENDVFMNVAGLFDANQNPGHVRVIKESPNGKYVYVAGNFSYAGLLNCNSICALSTDIRQWTSITQELQGTITDMEVEGSDIILIGELSVNNQKTYSTVLKNTEGVWSTERLDDIPGIPSTLLRQGSGEYLISGESGNELFIGTWNKEQFTPLETNLGSSSFIRQLKFMPITESPSISRYPRNTNTMLMAVGHLDLPVYGNSSAALFDGSVWYPFLLAASSSGGSGSINQLFTSSDCCTADSIKRYLSVPAVILISIAISLSIIFLTVAIAYLFIFFKRRNSVHNYATEPMTEWKPHHRQSSLAAMLDEVAGAGMAVGLAGSSAAAGMSNSKSDLTLGYSTGVNGGTRIKTSMDISDRPSHRNRNSSHFSGPILNNTTVPFSILVANALKKDDPTFPVSSEHPSVFYAKYPFEAKEFGELALDANVPIVVTDTSDDVWWMGYIDDGSGNPISGLFPSNYVTKLKPSS